MQDRICLFDYLLLLCPDPPVCTWLANNLTNRKFSLFHLRREYFTLLVYRVLIILVIHTVHERMLKLLRRVILPLCRQVLRPSLISRSLEPFFILFLDHLCGLLLDQSWLENSRPS